MQGDAARAGGWGYLFGDEGSGYSRATAALRSAAQAADGRGPATLLLERFPQHLQVPTPLQLVEVLYAPEMTRRRVSQLAPLVLQAATDQDPVAHQLVRTAANDLASIVGALQRRLQLPLREMPLALAGSLLLNSELLQRLLLKQLQAAHGIEPLTSHVAEPVSGAAALARRMLQ